MKTEEAFDKIKMDIQRLKESLQEAINAGEYVVNLVEATGNAGISANPFEKADWHGALLHCYAAMAFLNKARKTLEET